MKIRDILDRKGRDVVTVAPERTVHEAMRVLVEHDIGALVVIRGEEVVGVISERDVLRLGAQEPDGLRTRRVEEIMTRDLVIGVPGDRIGYVMEVMTENRVRHLPILEEGCLAGIVSIGDVVNASREDVRSENRYLRDYIQGRC